MGAHPGPVADQPNRLRTTREPLVLILHAGYGWVVLSLLAIGCAILGIGLPQANAVHVLTTGAVGTMTLGIMTRASLGHTGRPKQGDGFTMAIYGLVNGGALLRILVPTPDALTTLTHLLLGLAALGAYVLFALVYGPFLLRPALEE
ncbi:MAG TPA: NnrS family protein [Nitrospira sp.]